MTKTFLYYDTETTGLPDFRKQAQDYRNQPAIAQIAAALVIDGEITESIQSILQLREQHCIVQERALEIHGINREMMQKMGKNPKDVMQSFWNLVGRADVVIGHNVNFDIKMVRIELHRCGLANLAEEFRDVKTECTMKMADDIMQLAPTEKMLAAGFTKSKPPRLEEAYQFFVGEPMSGAHDAWNDVLATIKVHHAIMEWTGGLKEIVPDVKPDYGNPPPAAIDNAAGIL